MPSFAQLTRPNGRLVWINGSSVSMLRAPHMGEYAPTVRTVIVAGLLTQGVREALNEAVAALNASGGNL